MLRYMLDPSDKDRAFLQLNKSDDTVLLVNNLGGVSPLEMGGITAEVVNQLSQTYSIKPVRILSGTYMTSLNGLGFSTSLLKLTDPALLSLLDAPAEAVGWSAPINTSTWDNRSDEPVELKDSNFTEDIHSNLQRTYPYHIHRATY